MFFFLPAFQLCSTISSPFLPLFPIFPVGVYFAFLVSTMLCSLLHHPYLERSLCCFEPNDQLTVVVCLIVFNVFPPLSFLYFRRGGHPFIICFFWLPSSLLHGDQHHLMGNMFNLMIFGKMAEEDMGSLGKKRALSTCRTTRLPRLPRHIVVLKNQSFARSKGWRAVLTSQYLV